MAGPPTAGPVAGRAGELAAVAARIGPRFARREPRSRAIGYVRGLLSHTGRKNGWQLAEHLGDPTPDGVQHRLARADWDADAARDGLIGYVAEQLGDPAGVLVVDETGFLKKGGRSAGAARPYPGTAGRVENGQVGVFLGYAAPRGRALIDRALYLPKGWAAGPARRGRAGIPQDVGFATRLVLARRAVERAAAAGVPAGWVTADAAYGSDSRSRSALEGLGLGYVLGVRADSAAWVGARPARARALLAEGPAGGWRRLSCGGGAKGPRLYDWALRRTNCPEPGRYARRRLIRRSVSRPEQVADFACGGPPGTALAGLARVAGVRWSVEGCFELAKGGCGLAGYEVRSWVGWHRHVTLSLWALAVVAVVRSRVPAPARANKGRRAWCR
jgi:SRSO17 transposase